MYAQCLPLSVVECALSLFHVQGVPFECGMETRSSCGGSDGTVTRLVGRVEDLEFVVLENGNMEFYTMR